MLGGYPATSKAQASLGSTMPEDLPTPTGRIQQLRKQEALRPQRLLEAERQPSLFPADDPEPSAGEGEGE